MKRAILLLALIWPSIGLSQFQLLPAPDARKQVVLGRDIIRSDGLEWRLVQMLNGWAIYDAPRPGSYPFEPYMIAIRADGITRKERLRPGADMWFQIGFDWKLKRLPDTITKDTRGFDVTVRRYVVLSHDTEHN